MTRGRRPNLSVEPSRQLQTQRAFRQRKAAHLQELEETIQKQKQEILLLRQQISDGETVTKKRRLSSDQSPNTAFRSSPLQPGCHQCQVMYDENARLNRLLHGARSQLDSYSKSYAASAEPEQGPSRRNSASHHRNETASSAFSSVASPVSSILTSPVSSRATSSTSTSVDENPRHTKQSAPHPLHQKSYPRHIQLHHRDAYRDSTNDTHPPPGGHERQFHHNQGTAQTERAPFLPSPNGLQDPQRRHPCEQNSPMNRQLAPILHPPTSCSASMQQGPRSCQHDMARTSYQNNHIPAPMEPPANRSYMPNEDKCCLGLFDCDADGKIIV
ncbi:unnamed protein product [Sympodiomycopsis kandeliae]